MAPVTDLASTKPVTRGKAALAGMGVLPVPVSGHHLLSLPRLPSCPGCWGLPGASLWPRCCGSTPEVSRDSGSWPRTECLPAGRGATALPFWWEVGPCVWQGGPGEWGRRGVLELGPACCPCHLCSQYERQGSVRGGQTLCDRSLLQPGMASDPLPPTGPPQGHQLSPSRGTEGRVHGCLAPPHGRLPCPPPALSTDLLDQSGLTPAEEA